MSEKMENLHAYRIGLWTHRWWPRASLLRCLLRGAQPDGRRAPRVKYLHTIQRDLRLIRRPHRPWQAEYDSCCWCPRSWTKAGALRKAERDLAYQQATGQWSPWIRRKVHRRYGPGAAMGSKTR